jgi:cytochrome c553
MKRIIITTSFVAIAAWFAAPADVSAGEALGNVDKGRVIYQFGKGDDIPACAGCHAEDGLGSDEVGSPRLAYQIAPYVRKQLHDFGKDLRTDDTMYQMNDIAKAMSEEDINDVAAYVHTLIPRILAPIWTSCVVMVPMLAIHTRVR